ncbi:MAG: DNA recombination protein RmuC [Candidatus Staskawiczbacteria bacterium]|nr:DNA recombination protein RmuC [Candidatus Staskawiczbacteria bacterium]
MDITTILLIVIAVGIIIAVFLLLRREKKDLPAQAGDGSLLMLQQQLNQVAQAVDSKLSESNKNVQEQFKHSADIIRNVTEKLTKLDETNRQVVGFADQLKSLQDILKNPKQRGILGEYYLETVLKNVLPPSSFQMQYSFSNGEIVDAVVFVDKRIIPIDSKFSLDNYNRMLQTNDPVEIKRLETAFVNDLKLRIDETAKYVRPEEKTMDFAFMFIPSEAVYYDLLINKVGVIAEDTNNLIYYAGKKKVIVVSPTSFLAYLQTVLQGLRNQKISEQAQTIIKEVERLGKHLFTYSEHFNRLGQHLDETVGSFNKAKVEFAKVDKDVIKLAGGESKLKLEEVERPAIDSGQ